MEPNTLNLEDTIVAWATSSIGQGSRAVLRLSGPLALPLAQHVTNQKFVPLRKPFRALFNLEGISAPLPGFCLAFQGPRSYTGQDLLEIHTLQAPALVELLLQQLLTLGCRWARPGEFTMRAFLAGKMTLVQAEAVMSIIDAASSRELRQALAYLAGNLSSPLLEMRQQLLDHLADVEAGLDFVDEDIEFISTEHLIEQIGGLVARLTNLKRQIDSRGQATTLSRVVLLGPPNAGKSSLFNALAGHNLALVSDIQGTTRDTLVTTITLDDIPIQLIDTAGWQSPENIIEQQAQEHRDQETERAELQVICIPRGTVLSHQEESWLRSSGAKLFVQTKSDQREAATLPYHPAVSSSTQHPEGLTELRQALKRQLLQSESMVHSLSRCRGHVEIAIQELRQALALCIMNEPAEILALPLRAALKELGEIVGAVYTNDLLDRIFSRFCIGK